MMTNYTQTLNASAISQIGTEPVVYMTASIRGAEPPVINILYQNPELYNSNKDQADADIEEFRQKVFSSFSGSGAGVTQNE